MNRVEISDVLESHTSVSLRLCGYNKKLFKPQRRRDTEKKELRKNTRGFTLVEVVIVTLLLAIIATILYRTLMSIQTSIKIIDNERSAGRTAQFVFSRLTQELSNRYQLPLSSEGNSLFATGQPSVIGKNQESGKSALDSIQFITESVSDITSGNQGVVEILYTLKEDSERKDPEDEYKNYILVREEIPWGVKDENTAKKRKISWPIAENVVSFNIRYFSQDSWQDEWTGPIVPFAVSITLKVRGDGGKIETYKTAISLNRKRSSRQPSNPSG